MRAEAHDGDTEARVDHAHAPLDPIGAGMSNPDDLAAGFAAVILDALRRVARHGATT